MVDKLGEDCAGNIHEVKMEKITSAEYENGHKLSAHCILCYFKNLCNQHWNWYLFCLLQIHESWLKKKQLLKEFYFSNNNLLNVISLNI